MDKKIQLILESKRIVVTLYTLIFLTLIRDILELAYPSLLRDHFEMIDYHAFYLTGRLYWEGILNSAYDAVELFESQERILNTTSFMPWTYPPHYNFVAAILGTMPIAIGYLIFILTTLVFYLYQLKKVAQEYFSIVLLAIFPLVILCLSTGQNGFLIGGLLALFTRMMMTGSNYAAIPLSFLTIKPHFLPFIGLYLLFQRSWMIILVSIISTIIILGMATIVFTPSIWESFLSSVNEAKIFLVNGLYPFYRMISVYAFVYGLGFGASVAFGAQGIIATFWLYILILAIKNKWPQHHILATVFMGALFISPYAYDYDLGILGVAIVLIIKDFLSKVSFKEFSMMLALLWLGSFSGVILNALLDTSKSIDHAEQLGDVIQSNFSVGFIFIFLFCIVSLYIIRNRQEKPEKKIYI